MKSRTELIALAEAGNWDEIFVEIEGNTNPLDEDYKTYGHLLFPAVNQRKEMVIVKLLRVGADCSVGEGASQVSPVECLVRKGEISDNVLRCVEPFIAHAEALKEKGERVAALMEETDERLAAEALSWAEVFCNKARFGAVFLSLSRYPMRFRALLQRLIDLNVDVGFSFTRKHGEEYGFCALHFVIQAEDVVLTQQLVERGHYDRLISSGRSCSASPLCLAIEALNAKICHLLTIADPDDLSARFKFEKDYICALIVDGEMSVEQWNCLWIYCRESPEGRQLFKSQVFSSVQRGDWNGFDAFYKNHGPAIKEGLIEFGSGSGSDEGNEGVVSTGGAELAAFYGECLYFAAKQLDADRIGQLVLVAQAECNFFFLTKPDARPAGVAAWYSKDPQTFHNCIWPFIERARLIQESEGLESCKAFCEEARLADVLLVALKNQFVPETPGDDSFIPVLLNLGVRPHFQCNDGLPSTRDACIGYSCLHFAVCNGKHDDIVLLLKHDVYHYVMLKYRFLFDRTPLQLAFDQGDVESCRLLGSVESNLPEKHDTSTLEARFDFEHERWLNNADVTTWTNEQWACIAAFCLPDEAHDAMSDAIKKRVFSLIQDPAAVLLNAIEQGDCKVVLSLLPYFSWDDLSVGFLAEIEHGAVLKLLYDINQAGHDESDFLNMLSDFLHYQSIFRKACSFVNADRHRWLSHVGRELFEGLFDQKGGVRYIAAQKFLDYLDSLTSAVAVDEGPSASTAVTTEVGSGFVISHQGAIDARAVLRKVRYLQGAAFETFTEQAFGEVVECAGVLWGKTGSKLSDRKADCLDFAGDTPFEKIANFLRDADGSSNKNSFKCALAKAFLMIELGEDDFSSSAEGLVQNLIGVLDISVVVAQCHHALRNASVGDAVFADAQPSVQSQRILQYVLALDILNEQKPDVCVRVFRLFDLEPPSAWLNNAKNPGSHGDPVCEGILLALEAEFADSTARLADDEHIFAL